jgi:hypothetical protein
MEEKTYDKIYQEHTFVIVLGITSLTILILAGVAGSAPFVYLFCRYEPYSELCPVVPFQSKFPI